MNHKESVLFTKVTLFIIADDTVTADVAVNRGTGSVGETIVGLALEGLELKSGIGKQDKSNSAPVRIARLASKLLPAE